MWRISFREALGGDLDAHDFIYMENVEGEFNWSTKTVDNIKEAYGNPEAIKNAIKECDIAVSGYAPFTQKVLDASNNLKIVGISRGGPVNVDHQAATERNIIVLRAVGRNAESVADQTIGLILSEIRHIARHNKEIKTGEYFKKIHEMGRSDYLDSYNWIEANEKVLGLIGYGQVGSRVAKRANAFNMRVIVYDPYIDENILISDKCEPVQLETLLETSDFISIHSGLSSETHHLVNTEAFLKMKNTAVLVNTARGSIIDEKALYKALKNGAIASAALDVVEQDPIRVDNPLIQLENITLTPHTAGRSPDTELRGYRQIAQQVVKYIKGEEINLIHIANKDVLKD